MPKPKAKKKLTKAQKKKRFMDTYVGKEKKASTRAHAKGTSVHLTKPGYSIHPTNHKGIERITFKGDVVAYKVGKKIHAVKHKRGYKDAAYESKREKWDKGPEGLVEAIFG